MSNWSPNKPVLKSEVQKLEERIAELEAELAKETKRANMNYDAYMEERKENQRLKEELEIARNRDGFDFMREND